MKTRVKEWPVRTAQQVEQRNQEIWRGHPTVLEDVTHVLGGIGIGLLLYPVLERRSKATAWAMVLISTAIHFYADTVKPGHGSRIRRRLRRDGVVAAIRRRVLR